MARISSEQISGTQHHGRILFLNFFKCYPKQLREINTPSLARQLWYSSLKASLNQGFVFVLPFHSDGGVSRQWCYIFTVNLSHDWLLLAFVDCGDGFKHGGFGCCKIFQDLKSWHDAKLSCEQVYGALIMVDSLNKNKALESHLVISIYGEYIMSFYLCLSHTHMYMQTQTQRCTCCLPVHPSPSIGYIPKLVPFSLDDNMDNVS